MYELCPAIIGWNNSILTESIALSVTIIIIYFIIKYIKYPNISSGMPAIILSLILTFHRPTAIIYVVLLEIFWIGRFIFDRKQIKVDFKCFIASTISIFIIVVYAIIFHRTFEIYSITDAVVRQDLIVCIQEGYYKSSNNEQFIEYVNEALKNNDNSWYVMTDVKSKYNNAEVKELTNYCRMQNMSKYIKYIYDLTIEHETIYYDNYLVNTRNTVDVALFKFITFSHIYAIIAIEFILVVYYWIKDKKVPWVHCGLFGFPFVIVFSSFVGTCGEFMRTSICALPFAYISIATYIDMLSKNKEGKNNDRIIEEE